MAYRVGSRKKVETDVFQRDGMSCASSLQDAVCRFFLPHLSHSFLALFALQSHGAGKDEFSGSGRTDFTREFNTQR